ncbi:MAG TPA: dihydroorotate dehydrogenase [Dehalococcoidia bacterium]|nr:dihydroorotate dehydrogenase [Dehalococcoidia bacterium]
MIPPAIGGRRGTTLELASPVMIASGCFGRGLGAQQRRWLRDVGALVTHSLTLEPRSHGANPVIDEATGGVLYTSGLPNRGLARELATGAETWAAAGLPVVVSIAASDVRGLATMAADLDGIAGVAAIELNLPAGAEDVGALADAVAGVAAVTLLPLIVKLEAVPVSLTAAQRALAAGADAICVASGWRAWQAGMPGSVKLTGPATMPLTLLLVSELFEAGIEPLIACGGVDSAAAARAYLEAGACAVQIGSALLRDPTTATRIAAELRDDRRVLTPAEAGR